VPLYVVATPIGNLEDLSSRALRVLSECERVFAEDTRHTGGLFSRFGIATPLESLHAHNEESKAARIVALLDAGASLALVSDAGTPAISDPGHVVVRAVLRAGHRVIPVPGPSALTAFASAAGLPTDELLFVGFVPRGTGPRRAAIESWLDSGHTVVMYESPNRVRELLSDLAEIGPTADVVVARELTKQFETWYRGCAAEVAAQVTEDDARGEFVVGVRGEPVAKAPREIEPWVQALAAEGLKTKQIARVIGQALGLPADEVYREALKVRRSPQSSQE
jgi:16S rRNA (cytidine1402-2'-O)-methyltransferase